MDKNKVIAEIKRRFYEDYNGPDEHENEIAQGVCAGLLSFINSLPEELSENSGQLASEDLEKAAEESAMAWRKNPDGSESKELYIQPHIRGFKAGARWQKEQDIKLIQRTKDSWYKEGFVNGQIEGLSDDEKYQQGRFDEREQMMKGAEPAEIGYFNQNGLSILPERSIKRMNFDEGDKVKIIIVKGD